MLEIDFDLQRMRSDFPLPAGSASPPAGTCRGAPIAGAPALPPDFDAAGSLREARIAARRFGPRWMFIVWPWLSSPCRGWFPGG